MAFNPNIPAPTDKLSQSQQDILANFQAIAPLFDQGTQQYIDLPVQPSAPTFSPGDEGIYNLNYTTTSLNELFVHKQTSAGTADIPMTASILSTVAAPIPGSSGWTYLPSGLLLKWGQASGNGSATFDTTSLPGPAFTGIIHVQLTPASGTAGDANFAVRLVGINNPNQVLVYLSSRTSTGAAPGSYYIFIIGY
jgi:hypothetical protein